LSPDGAITLAWETASEMDLLGFHLYRAEAVSDPRTRLTEDLLPVQAPGSPVGAGYIVRPPSSRRSGQPVGMYLPKMLSASAWASANLCRMSSQDRIQLGRFRTIK
jgi:hypothetical protein